MTQKDTHTDGADGSERDSEFSVGRRGLLKGGLVTGGLLGGVGLASAGSAVASDDPHAQSHDGTTFGPIAGEGSDLILLDIAGIEGSSKVADHEDEIDCLAWLLEVGRTTDSGADRRATGRPTFGPLVVAMEVGKTTPQLMSSAASGRVHPQARLTLVSKAGDATVEYLVVELSDVQVESVGDRGVTGQRFVQEASLRYERIVVEAYEVDETFTVVDTFSFGWDVGANEPLELE